MLFTFEKGKLYKVVAERVLVDFPKNNFFLYRDDIILFLKKEYREPLKAINYDYSSYYFLFKDKIIIKHSTSNIYKLIESVAPIGEK